MPTSAVKPKNVVHLHALHNLLQAVSTRISKPRFAEPPSKTSRRKSASAAVTPDMPSDPAAKAAEGYVERDRVLLRTKLS